MLGIVGYGAFVASAAALCLTPGIDTVYILTRTMAGGRREGLASAFGINTGLIVHTLLVTAGLSLVLAASPIAFGIIKFAGAAYLIVMGIKSLLSQGPSFSTQKESPVETRASSAEKGMDEKSTSGALRTYCQGVLTNVLNPKIILFFLALLPQFVAMPNSYGSIPFLVLGLTYVVLSTLWTVIIVLIASPFSRFLRKNPHTGKVTSIVSGLVYIVLGGMILFTA